MIKTMPVAKLTRTNHQKHIVDVMPLIAAVFAVQCYLMGQFGAAIDTGNLALAMALGLSGFVGALFWYDKNHIILVFEDKIQSGIKGFGRVKTVKFEEIEQVLRPEKESNFSNLVLKLKCGSTRVFYFVDHPKASSEFLSHQIEMHKQKESESAVKAA